MKVTLISMDEYRLRTQTAKGLSAKQIKVGSTPTGASNLHDIVEEGFGLHSPFLEEVIRNQMAGNENKKKEPSFGHPSPAPKPSGGKKKKTK